jgi:murein DD-endopeptidase MepM/ murein hydrolase activator NlpD
MKESCEVIACCLEEFPYYCRILTKREYRMVLTRVWFIIAGVLLLSYTPALAEPYLRVRQKGVVYYYFNNREPRQEGSNTIELRGEARTQEQLPYQILPLSSVKSPIRAEPNANLVANSPQGDLGPGQLMPGNSAALPVVNLFDAKVNIGAAKRYLLRLLTKLSFFDPPVWPPGDAGPHWLVCHSVPESHFVVPDVWLKVPKYFQEPSENRSWLGVPGAGVNLPNYVYKPRLLGRVPPGSGGRNALSSLYYCFPVARPFTFRDTWGDPRSGGRMHRAVDIFAQEGTEVYAITAGVVQTLATLPGAGITLMLRGHDGLGYGYMHLQGYAPDIMEGKVVRTGELIGYVGHTGTQNCADHLHLQVYADHCLSRDSLVNPYDFLVQLCRGIGVTDLHQPKIARKDDPEIKVKANNVKGNKVIWIQVYQRPWSNALGKRGDQLSTKNSTILVIKNF